MSGRKSGEVSSLLSLGKKSKDEINRNLNNNFNQNIKKNNFTVFFGFKTASFIDSQTDWKTFLFSKTKKNLE